MIAKPIELRGAGNTVCFAKDPVSPEDQQYFGEVKSAAVAKMAIVSPTVLYFAGQIPFMGEAASWLGQFVDDVQSAVPGGQSRLAQGFKKYVLSLPTAWAFTRPVACEEDHESVTVTIEYLRAPKMPFVGGFL